MCHADQHPWKTSPPCLRYEYLQTRGRTHFLNCFDRGWLRNVAEFWSGSQEHTDWDAMRVAVDAGEVNP